MFGFVFGILTVGALVGAFRFGARRGRWGSWRGRYGSSYRRGGWVIDRLMWRLGARPDQEAEIRKALEDLLAEISGHRSLLEALRADLAAALAGDSSDAGVLDAAFAKVQSAAGSAKEATRKAFARLHATLDAGQRARLADLLRGGYASGYGGRCGVRGAHPVQL